MTVQATRTKAEAAFSELFAAAEAHLPGNGAVRALRREAIGRFQARGLPHRRIEEWKYTDLRGAVKDAPPLAAGNTGADAAFVASALEQALGGAPASGDWIVFADGVLIGSHGRLSAANSLAAVLAAPPSWVMDELSRPAAPSDEGVAALNVSLMSDGVVLDVPAGSEWTEPLRLVFGAAPQASGARSVFTHNVIRVGRGAKVVLVESHFADRAHPRHSSSFTRLIIEDDADVVHVKTGGFGVGDTHVSNWTVRLGANATYRPLQMTSGEGYVRNTLNLAFEGQHSMFDFAAATVMHQGAHADTTLVIDHKVPHCTSRELYKAVLDGTARAVFQGKVIVRPNAQKSDGKQMAQALMLSPDAEFDSKPELEIYADDVVCGHGSTAAELDPDLVFYCRSRGIPEATARALLVESFIGEAIEKAGHSALSEALMAAARRSLGQETV